MRSLKESLMSNSSIINESGVSVTNYNTVSILSLVKSGKIEEDNIEVVLSDLSVLIEGSMTGVLDSSKHAIFRYFKIEKRTTSINILYFKSKDFSIGVNLQNGDVNIYGDINTPLNYNLAALFFSSFSDVKKLEFFIKTANNVIKKFFDSL